MAEVLDAFFASVSKIQTSCPQNTSLTELEIGDGEVREALTIQETVNDVLCQLEVYKSMGPCGIHLKVMRRPVKEFHKLLSIIYQHSWSTGEVLAVWKLANVTPINKKGWKDGPRSYRPVSLTSVPGKVMEEIILTAITLHMQDSQGIRPSQHGFMKGRSCLTNLISFYNPLSR